MIDPANPKMEDFAAAAGVPARKPFEEERYCRPCGENLPPSQVVCPFCDEPSMTLSDASEAYWMSLYEGEPPLSMDEIHERAWRQKQELRR